MQEYKIIKIEDFEDKENCILRQVQPDVEFPLSEENKELIAYMKEFCLEKEGMGLAAVQIGAAKNIAVIQVPESAVHLRENAVYCPIHSIINGSYEPIIEEGTSEDFEACFSVGTVMAKVRRFNSIKVRYQNEQGDLIERIEEGFYAKVFQHEIDHCRGILFTDLLDENSLQGTHTEMLKIRRQELPEEKRTLFDEIMRAKGIELELRS